MGDKGYLITFCLCGSGAISRDNIPPWHPPWQRRGEGETLSQRKCYAPPSGRMGEGRDFLCLFLLTCLQLKIILMQRDKF